MREKSHFLSELDDSKLDSDGFTEWDHFMTLAIEVLAKIAEMYPNGVLEIIVGSERFGTGHSSPRHRFSKRIWRLSPSLKRVGLHESYQNFLMITFSPQSRTVRDTCL